MSKGHSHMHHLVQSLTIARVCIWDIYTDENGNTMQKKFTNNELLCCALSWKIWARSGNGTALRESCSSISEEILVWCYCFNGNWNCCGRQFSRQAHNCSVDLQLELVARKVIKVRELYFTPQNACPLSPADGQRRNSPKKCCRIKIVCVWVSW